MTTESSSTQLTTTISSCDPQILGSALSPMMANRAAAPAACVTTQDQLDLRCATQTLCPSRVIPGKTDLSGVPFNFSNLPGIRNIRVTSGDGMVSFDGTQWTGNVVNIETSNLSGSTWNGVDFTKIMLFFIDTNLSYSQWSNILVGLGDMDHWQIYSGGLNFYNCYMSNSFINSVALPSTYHGVSLLIMYESTGSITFSGNYPSVTPHFVGINADSIQIRNANFGSIVFDDLIFLSGISHVKSLFIENVTATDGLIQRSNHVSIDTLIISDSQFNKISLDGINTSELDVRRSSVSSWSFTSTSSDLMRFEITDSNLYCANEIWDQGTSDAGIVAKRVDSFHVTRSSLNGCRNEIGSLRELVWQDVQATNVVTSVTKDDITENVTLVDTTVLSNNDMRRLATFSGLKAHQFIAFNTTFKQPYSSFLKEQQPPIFDNTKTQMLTLVNVTFDNVILTNWQTAHPKFDGVWFSGSQNKITNVTWMCSPQGRACLPAGVNIQNNTLVTLTCAAPAAKSQTNTENFFGRFFKRATAPTILLAVAPQYPSCDTADLSPPIQKFNYDIILWAVLVTTSFAFLCYIGYRFYRCYWPATEQDAELNIETKIEDFAIVIDRESQDEPTSEFEEILSEVMPLNPQKDKISYGTQARLTT